MEWLYCSQEEGLQREQMFDVHILEASEETKHLSSNRRKIDSRRAVRKFIRSGGDNLHLRLPSRSLEQLKATAAYLTQTWYSQACSDVQSSSARAAQLDSIGVLYSFVMDRVNAIRQELVSEKWVGMETVRLLLALCRLYIYLGARCRDLSATCDGTEGDHGNTKAGEDFVLGWFDPHMHDNAQISCITAALGAAKDITTASASASASASGASDSGGEQQHSQPQREALSSAAELADIIDELQCYSLLQRTYHAFARAIEAAVVSCSPAPLSPLLLP